MASGCQGWQGARRAAEELDGCERTSLIGAEASKVDPVPTAEPGATNGRKGARVAVRVVLVVVDECGIRASRQSLLISAIQIFSSVMELALHVQIWTAAP